MRVQTLGNVGAYLSNMASGGPTVNTINFGTGTYKIDNYEAISRVVVTNTVPVDAYRGYGRPEGAYIAERTIDAVARHLGLDQVEVRRKNFIERKDFPYRPYGSMGVMYDSGNYQGCLDKALTAFDYEKRQGERDALRRDGVYRGIGIAAYTHMCGMAPSRRLALSGFDRGGWESARVSIDSSGRATIYSGSMSQGHGHVTSLSQIAADVLQLPIENIDVVQGDTRQVQAGHGTFNSRSMAVGGSSVHVCSERIVAKAKLIAAGMLEVDEKDVSYKAGAFGVPGTDIAPVTFAKVARMAYVGHKLPDGMAPGLDETVFYDPVGMGSPSGVHLAHVEVDPDTGKVTILRYTAVQDVGRAIHPSYVEGQIQGGVGQGIGWALNEEFVYNDNGNMVNSSFLDYRMPTTLDLPMIETVLVEVPNPGHPYGVRGVGEVPIVPPVAALANAIYRATGKRMTHSPMSPGYVLSKLLE
jgi:carbon-monoxide dehydrogenase large subunit